jgi:hypothetical protein
MDQLEPDLLELDEPPLWEQVKEMFRGRLRWLMVLLTFVHFASVVFAIASAVCFFRAESVREMIAWASGFGLGLILAIACRIFGWIVWQKNSSCGRSSGSSGKSPAWQIS